MAPSGPIFNSQRSGRGQRRGGRPCKLEALVQALDASQLERWADALLDARSLADLPRG